MGARHLWVSEWRDAFRRYYEEVSGGDSATMTYVPKVAVEDWDDDGIYEACRENLNSSLGRRSSAAEYECRAPSGRTPAHARRRRERSRGEGVRLGRAAPNRGTRAPPWSRGTRSAGARDSAPVLLLDDAFAELDDARRERIFGLMGQDRFGQVIITAPNERDVPLQGDALPRWGIHEGRICA